MPDPLIDEGLAHHQAGRLDEAAACYQAIFRIHPHHADAWHLLGLISHHRGQFALAVEQIQHAIAHSSGPGLYYTSLGVALMHLGRYADAEAAYREALARGPVSVAMWLNLAEAHRVQGKLVDRIACYREALRVDPNHAPTQNNLGVALQERGDIAEAMQCYQRAVELAPDFAQAWNNLAYMVNLAGDRQTAIACYQRGLALNPDDFVALNNLGNVLREAGKFAEAEGCYLAALGLSPECVECHNNLGMLLRESGRQDAAIQQFHAALRAAPRYETAWRNLLTTLLYQSGISQQHLFDEHRACAASLTQQIAPLPPPVITLNAERRLRIGWVSSDFREHPIARNVMPLLRHADHARFEHILYSDCPVPDATSAAIQSVVGRVQSIVGLTDEQVARQIREDGIDILITLAGHFDRNRPLIAAYRPAPLQVSFHDAATSGLDAQDYLISDRTMTPKHGVERFTERVLRLPTFYVHAPLVTAPPITPLPSQQAGAITFGNFGNPAKINAQVIAVWARVLQALPTARLMLKYKNIYEDSGVRSHFEQAFAAHGVSSARLVWHGSNSQAAEHLGAYGLADIVLDTFPFNGSTTTFEALWMGVPVLTLLGENMVGRWGASMLRAIGMNTWVARDEADYVALAQRFATDINALATLRADLRARVAASPLCDEAGRARQVQCLLRSIWRRHCRAAAA